MEVVEEPSIEAVRTKGPLDIRDVERHPSIFQEIRSPVEVKLEKPSIIRVLAP
jgi:hypothetical protein